MAGISQYFHGESGQVVGLCWVYDERLMLALSLRGDPHRLVAYDYGSDIGIDPALVEGGDAVYLRLSPYHGIWLALANQFHPKLEQAEKRVTRQSRLMEKCSSLSRLERRRLLDSLGEKTGIPLCGDATVPQPGRAVAPISLFLSYSSRNVLLARTVRENLAREANSDVWFDLAQAGEAPEHDDRIERWLETAIHGVRVFVVLSTRHAVASSWVHKEVDWALARAQASEAFHLVVLKLDEAPVPERARRAGRVVDCSGLAYGELLEEVYSAIYERMSRRAWLAEQRRHGWPGWTEPASGYDQWRSDAGVARELSWEGSGRESVWTLRYEADGVEHEVGGGGEKEVVDPAIAPGDRVGLLMFAGHTPIWMRSVDLELSPNAVFGAYLKRLNYSPAVRLMNGLAVFLGSGLVLAIAWSVTRVADEILRFIAWTLGLATRIGPAGVGVASDPMLLGFRMLLAVSVLGWGLYQLVGVAHPLRYENRGPSSVFDLMRRGLPLVAWGAFVYSLVFLLLATIGYGLVALFAVHALQLRVGYSALIGGFVVAYGAVVLYGVWRLVRFLRRNPGRAVFWWRYQLLP